MAIIAGAAHALKYKEEKPTAHESEIIQHITSNASKILREIDEDWFLGKINYSEKHI